MRWKNISLKFQKWMMGKFAGNPRFGLNTRVCGESSFKSSHWQLCHWVCPKNACSWSVSWTTVGHSWTILSILGDSHPINKTSYWVLWRISFMWDDHSPHIMFSPWRLWLCDYAWRMPTDGCWVHPMTFHQLSHVFEDMFPMIRLLRNPINHQAWMVETCWNPKSNGINNLSTAGFRNHPQYSPHNIWLYFRYSTLGP